MTSSASIENSVIDPDNAQSRAHWATRFNVSEVELLRAIGVIGTAPAALEFYLRPDKPRIPAGYKQGRIAKELRAGAAKASKSSGRNHVGKRANPR